MVTLVCRRARERVSLSGPHLAWRIVIIVCLVNTTRSLGHNGHFSVTMLHSAKYTLLPDTTIYSFIGFPLDAVKLHTVELDAVKLHTVELGYIASLRTVEFIRYIRGNFYCFVLWGPKYLSDITESDICKFYYSRLRLIKPPWHRPIVILYAEYLIKRIFTFVIIKYKISKK